MAKVTMHKDVETPSQAIVKAANQVTRITDSRGRAIEVKKLQMLDRMKMFEVIGPENSKNETYMGYAALAFSVASIDGVPVARPANKIQFDALIQNLADEGFEAVAEYFAAEIKRAQEAAEAETDALKNGSSTPS